MLLEDYPGIGKITLTKTLARSIDVQFFRHFRHVLICLNAFFIVFIEWAIRSDTGGLGDSQKKEFCS